MRHQKITSRLRLLRWFLLYLVLAGVAALLAAYLSEVPQHDAQPWIYSGNRPVFPSLTGFWAIAMPIAAGYSLRRLPVALLEALLLSRLFSSGRLQWRYWWFGMLLPLVVELFWQAAYSGHWVEGIWEMLTPWDSYAYLVPPEMIWPNVFSNLTPPIVAGIAVTLIARREASSKSPVGPTASE